MKRILVGLNNSEYSRAAAQVALAWAERHAAELMGLAVVDLPHLAGPQPTPLGGGAYKAERDEVVVEQARAAAREVCERFAEQCAAKGVQCQSMQQEGDPATLLAMWAQQADLLVVGRKSPPPDFAVPGSRVLEDLLHRTPRPVLCVPSAAAAGESVLVAYDGSPQAAKTLHAFQTSGAAAGRPIHLLRVTSDPRERHDVELAAEYLKLHGHDATLHVASAQAPPAAVILAEAQRLGAGLIVMGAFGRPRLAEFLFGSVTKSVLRDSKLPLLLYH